MTEQDRDTAARLAIAPRVFDQEATAHGLRGTDLRALLGLAAAADIIQRVHVAGGVDRVAVHSVYYSQLRRLIAGGYLRRRPRTRGINGQRATVEVTASGQRVAALIARRIADAAGEYLTACGKNL